MPVFTPNITERFIYTDFINMMNIRAFTTLNIYVNSVTGLNSGQGRGSSPRTAYKNLKFALNDAMTLMNKSQVVIHLAGADPHILDDGFVFPEILSPDEVTLDPAPTFGFDKRAPLVLRADPTLVATIAAIDIVSQADNAFSGLKEITTTGGLTPSAFAGKWMLDATGALARISDNDATIIYLCYAGVNLTGPLLVYGEGATVASANPLSLNSTIVLRGGAAPIILEGLAVSATAGGAAVEVGPNQQAILIACDIEKLSAGGGGLNTGLTGQSSVELTACKVTDWQLQGAKLHITSCYSESGRFQGSPQSSEADVLGCFFHDMFGPLFFTAAGSLSRLQVNFSKVDMARSNPGIRMSGGVLKCSNVDIANNANIGILLQNRCVASLNDVKSSLPNQNTGLNVQQSTVTVDNGTDLAGTTQDLKVGSLVIGTWAANFRAGTAPFGVNDPQSNALVFEPGVALSTAPQNAVRTTLLPVDSATKADQNILADASLNPITVVLPDPPTCEGLELTIKKIDATANPVIVSGGVFSIDAALTFPMAAQFDSITVVASATAWHIKALIP
jgi:hypothetical protein